MPKGNLWQLAVIVVFLAVLLPAVNIGYADSTHQETQENETITVTYTDTIPVAQDAYSYNDTIILRNSTGTTLEDGVDYEWYPRNGTLEYYDTTATTEGNQNNLTYTYGVHDQSTKDASFILNLFGEWGGILLLIGAIGALLGLIFRGSGSGGGGSF